MKRDVLCVGQAVYDMYLTDVPDDLMEQDGSQASKLTVSNGGDALNGAINMAALGVDVALCARIGDDDFGRSVLHRVAEMGVDTKYIKPVEGQQTSTSILLIDGDGEMHAAHVPGANDTFVNADVTYEMMREFRHLQFGSVFGLKKMLGEELATLLSRAHAQGMTTSMDTVNPRRGETVEDMLPALYHCDIFMPSYGEVVELIGKTELAEMKEYFRPYGIKLLGIKCGAKGLFVTDFERDVMVPSFATKESVVDTTGAGDSTLAAFVTGFVRGYDMEKCAALAMAQASLIVASVGANTGVRDFETIKKIAAEKGYAID
jgi:sugar/nucleoside kinase (ribokinase family)